MPIKDGDCYVFMAKDIFSGYVFQTGIEMDRGSDSLLKNVQLLMQDEDFRNHKGVKFTLVLHKYQEIAEEIRAFIAPHGGSLHINGNYVGEQMLDVMQYLFESVGGSR